MKMTITYLLFRLVAVISVLICGLLDKPVLASGAIAAIILYAIVGARVNRNDAARLESVGEQVYFVGYLSTISAFAGVILRVWVAGERPGDPRPILLMMGVALLTTVLGLMAMTIIKDRAQMLRRDPVIAESDDMSLIIGEDLIQAIGKIPAAINQAIRLDNSRYLTQITEKTTQTIERLNTQIESLASNTAILSKSVDQGAASSLQFTDNVKQLQSVLDEFVLLLERRLEMESQFDAENLNEETISYSTHTD